MSRNIGTKPSESIANKSVMSLQRIINDLKREIDSLKVRITKLGG